MENVYDASRLLPIRLVTAALGLLGLWTLGLGTTSAQAQTPVTSIVNGASGTTLEVTYSGGLLAPGKFTDLSNYSAPNDSIPASGAGTRMMWYPEKAAFRAGVVGVVGDGTQWDASKVGDYSAALGRDTKASSFGATAMGQRTTASGNSATAMGFGTTASGREATAMGGVTTASGNQATAMGAGTTAATNQSLSIGDCNSANTSADNSLLVAGNGTSGLDNSSCSDISDALVLKKDGDLAVGPSDPQDLRLHVTKNKANVGVTDNPSGNMVLFENTNDGTRPDVLGLQAGPSSPGSGVTYVSFYTRSGTTLGSIQGNGSGGIEITGTSADYAEELPVEEGAPKPEAGDIVGVRGGEVSLETSRADRVMIASEAPIMTGNATPATTADDDRRVAVAFVGQVPAKTRGSVEVGDLIVASGKGDGTARAVAPEDYRRAEHGPIAGQAWSAKEASEVGEVTVAVGLGRSGAVSERMEDQRERIAELESENEEIKKRLSALEAERNPSALAGLAGSGTGLLLTFLLGGLVGAGSIYRGR